MSKKAPNFFCEFCGAKVDKWAIQCDKCGRVFDSIKCPKCSYVGKADDFPNGCPQCGFHSSSLDQLRDSIKNAQSKASGGDTDEGESHNGHRHNHAGSASGTAAAPSRRGGTSRKVSAPKRTSEGQLPGWAYLLIIGLLSGVIGVMAMVLLNLLAE